MGYYEFYRRRVDLIVAIIYSLGTFAFRVLPYLFTFIFELGANLQSNQINYVKPHLKIIGNIYISDLHSRTPWTEIRFQK